jgi:hypothetical protein
MDIGNKCCDVVIEGAGSTVTSAVSCFVIGDVEPSGFGAK